MSLVYSNKKNWREYYSSDIRSVSDVVLGKAIAALLVTSVYGELHQVLLDMFIGFPIDKWSRAMQHHCVKAVDMLCVSLSKPDSFAMPLETHDDLLRYISFALTDPDTVYTGLDSVHYDDMDNQPVKKDRVNAISLHLNDKSAYQRLFRVVETAWPRAKAFLSEMDRQSSANKWVDTDPDPEYSARLSSNWHCRVSMPHVTSDNDVLIMPVKYTLPDGQSHWQNFFI